MLTLENELAVMPCQPSPATVVTTLTPLGHCASTERNVSGSIVTRAHLLFHLAKRCHGHGNDGGEAMSTMRDAVSPREICA